MKLKFHLKNARYEVEISTALRLSENYWSVVFLVDGLVAMTSAECVCIEQWIEQRIDYD